MASLRAQLTAWLAGLLTITAVLAGLAVGYATLQEQNRLLDDQLRQIALSVGDTPSAAGSDSRITAGANPNDRIAVQITRRDGVPLRSSDPSVTIAIRQQTGFTENADGDIIWRTFTLVTADRIIQVSQDTDFRTDIMRAAALNTMLPTGLLIPLSWLLIGLVVQRGLRPLNELSDELRATGGAERVKLPSELLPSELRPLADAANGLLDRQHELLKMRETFISDAAHQLRTPIAGLVLQLQNLKRQLPVQPDGTFRALEQGLARITALAGQLLNLARAEASASPLRRVQLCEAVRAAMAGAVEFAISRKIDLGLSEEVQATVEGDAIDISMLLANLIDNAVRYTPEGGSVDVRIASCADGCCVSIADTGHGIPEDELQRVFDRFHRVAPSSSEGSGLGLAIVQALAQRIGAAVTLANRIDGPGLDATVVFRSAD